VGSSREFPCVIHVEPDQSAANGVSALERDPQLVKVCGPRVMCRHKTSSLARRSRSTPPRSDARYVARIDPHYQLGNKMLGVCWYARSDLPSDDLGEVRSSSS
jgi:hypothetical protein